MTGIDIDITLTVLRLAAIVFGAAALFCLSRVGPGWLAGGLALSLGVLAVRINGGTMTGIDTSVQSWVRAHRSHAWQSEAGAVFGYLGQPLHFAVAAVFCGTVLSLHARSATRGALLLAVTGTGLVAEQTLKAIIGRTAESLVGYAHAFPSGHVTVWASFLGMVAVFLGTGRSRATRLALGLLAASGALAMAFLAVYSGAHTMTDVIGGVVLSASLVAFGTAVLRASLPTVRFSRAATVAAAVSTHTAPLRTEEIALSRGY